jgi:hypothetical protein
MYRIVIGAFWVHRDVFVLLFLLLLRCVCFFILIEVTFGFHMAKEFLKTTEVVEKGKKGRKRESLENFGGTFRLEEDFSISSIACMFTTHLVLKFY